MARFDFSAPIPEAKWLVKDLVPLGHLCVILAQSGAGNSFASESLAVSVAAGESWLGFDTTPGDVLIIDQDTPTNVLRERLKRICAAVGIPKHNIEYQSMQNLSLENGHISKLAHDLKPRLIIIDSLHSVCGKLNSNSTMAMAALAQLKADCLNPECTIVINHHLTEKLDYKMEELMSYDKHLSGMGSSVIKQTTDTEYILASTIKDNKIDLLYLRPIAKRQNIPQKVVSMRFLESDGYLNLEFAGYFDSTLTDAESDMLLLLESHPMDLTVKQAKEAMGSKWADKEIRRAFSTLEHKGKVIMSRHPRNLFTYRLPRIPLPTAIPPPIEPEQLPIPEPESAESHAETN